MACKQNHKKCMSTRLECGKNQKHLIWKVERGSLMYRHMAIVSMFEWVVEMSSFQTYSKSYSQTALEIKHTVFAIQLSFYSCPPAPHPSPVAFIAAQACISCDKLSQTHPYMVTHQRFNHPSVSHFLGLKLRGKCCPLSTCRPQ